MSNIILLEDQQLLRIAIKNLLQLDCHRQVHEVSNVDQAIEMLLFDTQVKLLILEITLPGAMEFIRRAIAMREGIKVIVLSSEGNMRTVHLALSLGASAYLLKECLRIELPLAIECVEKNRNYICSGLAAQVVTELLDRRMEPLGEKIDFSSREQEVLMLIADGLTNAEISEKLFLSKRTVEGHRQSLLNKTGSRNSAQLIGFAVRQGLIG